MEPASVEDNHWGAFRGGLLLHRAPSPALSPANSAHERSQNAPLVLHNRWRNNACTTTSSEEQGSDGAEDHNVAISPLSRHPPHVHLEEYLHEPLVDSTLVRMSPGYHDHDARSFPALALLDADLRRGNLASAPAGPLDLEGPLQPAMPGGIVVEHAAGRGLAGESVPHDPLAVLHGLATAAADGATFTEHLPEQLISDTSLASMLTEPHEPGTAALLPADVVEADSQPPRG